MPISELTVIPGTPNAPEDNECDLQEKELLISLEK